MGLASMRAVRKFGKGLHVRPFLDHSRAELFEYAEHNNLDWIEDPSNADKRIDRNFVRHEVIPAIKNRWPSVALPVARTIRIYSDTQLLLDEVAREDLSACATEKPDILVVDRLKRLSIPKQKNVLRYWSRALNLPPRIVGIYPMLFRTLYRQGMTQPPGSGGRGRSFIDTGIIFTLPPQ